MFCGVRWCLYLPFYKNPETISCKGRNHLLNSRNYLLNNVKLGLVIPAVLINPLCPNFFCNLKTGGPPRLINRWAYPRLINHHFMKPFHFSQKKPFLIGICWFTQQGEQEKKMLKKSQNGCGLGKLSIYPSKIFPHRNLLVYPTRGAGKKKC